MLCPRCEDVMLDEVDRKGVVIDLCKKCRGVWLDRGELEKLMTLDPVEARRRDPDDRYRDDDRRPYRKRSSLGDLMCDLFD